MNMYFRKCQHPNVVRLYACDAENLVIVSEFVEGGNLEQRLQSGTVPLADRLNMALDVARGMSWYAKYKKTRIYFANWGCRLAHEDRIGPNFVHRDLKPQNLLLEGNMIKICDFGLAVRYKFHSNIQTLIF